jgi:hypothetical protein
MIAATLPIGLTLTPEAKEGFYKALSVLLHSHSRLAQAEYHRNPRYNSSHFSHIAEEGMVKAMQDHLGINLIDFMNHYGDKANAG